MGLNFVSERQRIRLQWFSLCKLTWLEYSKSTLGDLRALNVFPSSKKLSLFRAIYADKFPITHSKK